VRILQALHFYLPRHSAGVEVYTRGLCRVLRQRHDVHLFFSEKIHAARNYSLREHEYEGVPCHVLVNNLLYDSFAGTYDQPQVLERFDEVLDRVQPDLLHVQHLMLLSLGIVERARRRDIPVVMTLHDFWLFCARLGQLLQADGARCDGPEDRKCAACLGDFKWRQSPLEARAIRGISWLQRATGIDLSEQVERWRRHRRQLRRPAPSVPVPVEWITARREAVQRFLGQVDLFLSPSRTVLEGSVRFGMPAERVRWLRQGYAPPAPAVPRAPAGAQGLRRVGYVGTLAPHKGVHVLVEAFRRAALPGAELWIHGSARSHPEYRRRLEELACGGPVHLAGELPNPRVPEFLASLDLLVMPSLWLENCPVILQEARFARVPVAASDLGGMAEVVRPGVDGWLYPPGDVAALAAGLQDLARSPGRLADWAAAAPAPMSMEEHAALLEEHYRSLCAKVSRR
jgi:glycosyltransferase involved in cell wall biosynthesis